MNAYRSFVAGLVAYGVMSMVPAAYAAEPTLAISNEAIPRLIEKAKSACQLLGIGFGLAA